MRRAFLFLTLVTCILSILGTADFPAKRGDSLLVAIRTSLLQGCQPSAIGSQFCSLVAFPSMSLSRAS